MLYGISEEEYREARRLGMLGARLPDWHARDAQAKAIRSWLASDYSTRGEAPRLDYWQPAVAEVRP